MTLPATTLALLVLAAAQTQRVAPPPPPPTSPTTFHSDALQLDYSYERRFSGLGDAVVDNAIKSETDKASSAEKAAVGCVSVPLTGIDSTNGFEMLMILRMDTACLGTDVPASQLGTVVSTALSGTLKRFGDPQMDPSSDYDLSSHKASATSGSVQAQQLGKTLYASASCVIQGKNVVCWEFIASECSRLANLTANPVKFKGEAAEPLIPARLSATCKATPSKN